VVFDFPQSSDSDPAHAGVALNQDRYGYFARISFFDASGIFDTMASTLRFFRLLTHRALVMLLSAVTLDVRFFSCPLSPDFNLPLVCIGMYV
jgi:hypothetical protein